MESPGVHDVFRLAGTTLEGRFVVDRAVAEGGFGVVYRGEQRNLERPVALKVLKTPPRYDEAARDQFLAGFAAEAKTIARITHANIVHVYDFGVSVMPSGERAAWMALEWLTGVTLDAELLGRRGNGGRTPKECLELLRPALVALGVVHAAGVAHRDLKPANIMLVDGPAGVAPKLLDFGIAKIMDTDETPGSGKTQTRSGQIAFSPGYASPEQISQGRSGPWTDVHAMGLILTEMLTDRAALEGDETGLIYQQIVDRVRPTPAKFGLKVGAWEGVLRRALAVSPSERYRDAKELLDALETTLAEATATHSILSNPSLLPGDAPPSSALGPFALMSTQRAPEPAVAHVTARSKVTTNTPTSNGDERIVHATPQRGPRSSLYATGALTVAVLGWGGYHYGLGMSHATPVSAEAPSAAEAPTPAASAEPASSSSAAAAPAASEAAPPEPAQPKATRTSVATPTAPGVILPPPARGKTPAPAASARPPAAASASAAAPDCSVKYTLDEHGGKKWKPECNR